MQFLSVAGRELRVAARKRSSFRLRIFTSCIALLVAGYALWFVTLFGSRPITGERLFFTLSWVTFLCACIVGPALTADCVNEEQNNGTLGLLFLTNLHGISIALGKLVGHGLLALYSIVSIVPVMALAALLGGTDAESLAKTALVLLITLILSLIIGMFASTVCRKAWVAAALALFILAVLVAGIPLAAFVLRENQRPDWSAWLELLSPNYSLSMASPSAAMLPSNHLWLALGVQMLIAVSFFGLITFFLPRVWKEGKSGRKAHYIYSIWRGLKYGSGEARRRLRARLLQINPILWLSCRERFGPMGLAMVLLVLAFAISWTGKQRLGSGSNADFLIPMIVWIVGIALLYLCFCFRLAAAASERFAVDRKAGALELILCTPMKTREILRGHWLGLVRRFWGAAIVLLALHAFALNYIMEAIRIEGIESRLRQFDLREVLVGPLRHIFGAAAIPNDVAPFYIACLAVLTAAILIVILWIALGWLGMALSLKLRREILAPWVSLFLLAVPPIPLFVIAVALLDDKKLFASDLFLGMLRMGASGFFIVLANALIWLFLARRWTYGKLRAAAAPLEATAQDKLEIETPEQLSNSTPQKTR
jgi:ABC-type transport system involved in multi-copper enzyme maturation permease subunit